MEEGTHLSPCSALMRVRAAAASSKAQLTDDVNLRRTSGSANALPSAVDSFPMPGKQWKESLVMCYSFISNGEQ